MGAMRICMRWILRACKTVPQGKSFDVILQFNDHRIREEVFAVDTINHIDLASEFSHAE